VNFSAFEQSLYFAAGAFADPDLNIGVALRITVQKPGQYTFDVLG